MSQTIELSWLFSPASVRSLLFRIGFNGWSDREPMTYLANVEPPQGLFAWPEFGPEVTAYLVGTVPYHLPGVLCRIEDPTPPGRALAQLYAAHRVAYPDIRAPALWTGCAAAWSNHKVTLDRLVGHGYPQMSVDGEFFGLAMRRVRRLALKCPDSLVLISKIPGQCVMHAGDETLHMPARGNWHVAVQCRAEELASLCMPRWPKGVRLDFEPGILTVNGKTIHGTWADEFGPATSQIRS